MKIPCLFIIIIVVQLYVLPTYSQSNFLAGMARVNITPEIPIRMSGYGNRNDPFTGIHDSIYATALVMQMELQKMAVVTADVVGFSHDFVDRTSKLIATQSDIPSENIMIIAAHNHGGPVTSVYTDNSSDAEERYYEFLRQQLAIVIKRASENLVPARVGAGKGRCSMNINRRARHAEGGIWLGRNPDGVCDQEVGILRIDDRQNQPIGAFLNWPCHATVTGQENTEITGDWPGAVAQFFSSKTNTMIMVTAGASADINPIYGPNNKWNDMTVIGQLLGEEAISVFNDIETFEPDQIRLEHTAIKADGKKRSASRMPNVPLETAASELIRISVLKVGAIALVGVSGELMTEIGMDIKADSPFKNTFIVTHCNGSSGYLCTDKAYEEGGYEPMVSRTMPGTAETIKAAARKLLRN